MPEMAPTIGQSHFEGAFTLPASHTRGLCTGDPGGYRLTGGMKACFVTTSSLTWLLLEDMMKRWQVDIQARQGLAKTESAQTTLMLDAFELHV